MNYLSPHLVVDVVNYLSPRLVVDVDVNVWQPCWCVEMIFAIITLMVPYLLSRQGD